MIADKDTLPHRAWPALWRRLSLWYRNAKTRADLRALDGHLRADVGLTRHQAHIEGAKGFWQR